MIKVGCCGFSVSKKKYFGSLSLVEVQRTFYRPPKPETAEKWKKSSPKKFEYAIKAWQLITHLPTSPTYRKAGIEIRHPESYGFFKPTKEVFDAWEETRNIANILQAKIIVFQCPPRFEGKREHRENMRGFFPR